MASLSKVNYSVPQNYVVKFIYENSSSFLLLCVEVNQRYQFVDLGKGKVYNLSFDTIQEAEDWLYAVAEVYEKNVIVTTYIP